MTVSGPSVVTNAARCAMFRADSLQRAAQLYLGDQDPRDPFASPLFGSLSGLPSLLIHVGASETLRDDATRSPSTPGPREPR